MDLENPVIRGNTADAIQKIAREKPEIFPPRIHRLLKAAEEDPVEMVHRHLAMCLGHMALFKELVGLTLAALVELLHAEEAFSSSWAMASLCIIANQYLSP